MDKNFSKWFPWIVLAVVVIVALFFVDFSKVFNSNQTVEEQIETLSADLGLDDIDDDAKYDIDTNVTADDDFIE